jgi:hypothetical protein
MAARAARADRRISPRRFRGAQLTGPGVAECKFSHGWALHVKNIGRRMIHVVKLWKGPTAA